MNNGNFAREAPTGTDRLDYELYANALAGLFSTGEPNVFPAAVGIYAPWGAGKVRLVLVCDAATVFIMSHPRHF